MFIFNYKQSFILSKVIHMYVSKLQVFIMTYPYYVKHWLTYINCIKTLAVNCNRTLWINNTLKLHIYTSFVTVYRVIFALCNFHPLYTCKQFRFVLKSPRHSFVMKETILLKPRSSTILKFARQLWGQIGRK